MTRGVAAFAPSWKVRRGHLRGRKERHGVMGYLERFPNSAFSGIFLPHSVHCHSSTIDYLLLSLNRLIQYWNLRESPHCYVAIDLNGNLYRILTQSVLFLGPDSRPTVY